MSAARLTLPTSAKQQLMHRLGTFLDQATALATRVGDAEVDDGARVPAALLEELKQIGDDIAQVQR